MTSPNHFDHKIKKLKKVKKRTAYFKLLMLGLLGLLIAFLLLWPEVKNMLQYMFLPQIKGGALSVKGIDLQKKFVEHPKYVGGGQYPYTLLAEKARQVSDAQIVLTKVKARITLKDLSILSIVADRGEINMGPKPTGIISGDVNFIYDKGDTELWTDNVFINMKEGFLENEQAVEGISTFGALKSQNGIYINQKNNFIKLKGQSDLLIVPGDSE